MGWIFYENAMPGHINKMPGVDESLCNSSTVTAADWDELTKGAFHDVAIMSSWELVEGDGPGQYDFSLFDAAVNFWKSRGKRIHIRFATDALWFGDYNKGAPDWLKEEPFNVPYMEVSRFTKTNGEPNICTFYDYNNAAYQERLINILTVLAEKYKDDPSVVAVDMMGYGLWGEWHSGYEYERYDLKEDGYPDYGNADKFREGEEGRANRDKALKSIIDAYVNAWGGTKKLSISTSSETSYIIPTEKMLEMSPSEFMKYQNIDYAVKNEEVTLRRNGIGGMVYDLDGEVLKAHFNSNTNKILFYEFAAERIAYDTPERAIEEALKFHGNYLSVLGHDSGGIGEFYTREDLFKKGAIELGYRLAPHTIQYPEKVSSGSIFKIYHEWTNEAFGRAVENYKLYFHFMKDGQEKAKVQANQFDTRYMLKGKNYKFESSVSLPKLENGRYELRISLESSGGNIFMPLENMDDKNRYLVGEIEVADGAVPKELRTSADMELSAGKSYEVSFDYTIKSASKNEYGYNNGFKVELKAGNEVLDSQTINGDANVAINHTMYIGKLAKDAEIVVSSIDSGEIEIGNVRVREINPEVVFDFEQENSLLKITEDNYAEISAEPAEVISGQKSLAVLKEREGVPVNAEYQQYYGARTNNAEWWPTPGKMYTVSFKAKTNLNIRDDYLQPPTPNQRYYGGAFFVEVVNVSTGETEYLYKWHDDVNEGTRQHTFNFYVKDNVKYTFRWGVLGPGGYSVDDVIITS